MPLAVKSWFDGTTKPTVRVDEAARLLGVSTLDGPSCEVTVSLVASTTRDELQFLVEQAHAAPISSSPPDAVDSARPPSLRRSPNPAAR